MEIQELYNKQKMFFNANETKEVSFRVEQLKKLKNLLKENEDILYEAIYKDFGKSKFETYLTELSLVYHEINIFIKNIKKWSARQRVKTDLANFPAKSYIIPEPLGITLVIGAWNYPYQLSLIPALTSLAAGNTAIIKPSNVPNETSKVLAKIINNNFPANYLYVQEGGVKETTELLKFKFDKIFFTGSIPVGKIIYQAAAKHLTPVILELGGKSPTFVFADCNLKMTVKRLVWSKFLNAGQTCIAPDYILVEKSIEETFLEAVKIEIQKYHTVQSELTDNYLRIINMKNFDRLTKLMDNAEVYCGGNVNREGRLIAPTVLKNVTFDDEIMKDEIFGPILPVLPFTDLDEVIRKVKERPKPLSCYVYGKNRKFIDKILNELSFGGGAINDSLTHLANSNLPFGGVGTSGIGSYHGKAGFDAFSHFKSILDKPFWFESSLKYPPYTKRKLSIIKRILE